MKADKTTGQDYVHYHKDGTIWAKGKTIGDVPNGYWEWFRKDGTKLRSGYFERGKQIGEWITYDKQGEIYKKTQMKDHPGKPAAARRGRRLVD